MSRGLSSVELSVAPVSGVTRASGGSTRGGGWGTPPTEREKGGEQARALLSPQSVTNRSDPRYGSRRWRRTAQAVLVRDLHVCRIVAGCPVRATVADHVIPTYPTMPDSLFFGMDNLRAGCQGHNKARGFAPDVPQVGPSSVVTRDYTDSDAG